jgi:hypothetical protein
MTAFTEQKEPEERWLSLGLEKDYYKSMYPYWFSVPETSRFPCTIFPEVHEWCSEQWGGQSARRWSQSRGAWRVRDDSTWAYFREVFYFKDPDHCVLFQLRWR